ncbi:hypothetical protein BC332_01738 [Capsicum chinense]|nr:hypothetical protein BC332_01738 [Capsicum chinense]
MEPIRFLPIMEKVVGSQVIGTLSSISVVSTSKGQTNMTPKNMNEKSAPGSAAETGFLEAAAANFYGPYAVYTIASTEQSTKDDSVSDTEDEDIDIDGKSQQAEGVDSNLLEEDNQTEVNFDEEANIGRQLNILKALDKKVAQDKELDKTKKKDNDHRNLYLAKKGLILEGTPAAEGVSVSDMYKNKGFNLDVNLLMLLFSDNSSSPDGTTSGAKCRHENSGCSTPTGPATGSFPTELREGDGKQI